MKIIFNSWFQFFMFVLSVLIVAGFTVGWIFGILLKMVF